MLGLGEILYLSGPVSVSPEDALERFSEYEIKLSRLGYAVINPMRESQFHDAILQVDLGSREYKTYFRFDTKLLITSSTLAFMPGWENSTGCNREFCIADWCGIPAFLADDLINKIPSPHQIVLATHNIRC